jgi:hypothetical protein
MKLCTYHYSICRAQFLQNLVGSSQIQVGPIYTVKVNKYGPPNEAHSILVAGAVVRNLQGAVENLDWAANFYDIVNLNPSGRKMG